MSMKSRDREVKRRIIRASEIGEYSYCSRAWWYRHVLKLTPPGRESAGRFDAGIAAHNKHGKALALSTTLRAFGIILALLGAVALLLALVTR